MLNGLCKEAGATFELPEQETFCDCGNKSQPVCSSRKDVFLCGEAQPGSVNNDPLSGQLHLYLHFLGLAVLKSTCYNI